MEDLGPLHERLAVIETKLDILVEGKQGLPARVAVLETAMHWVKGAAALAVALGGLFLGLLKVS